MVEEYQVDGAAGAGCFSHHHGYCHCCQELTRRTQLCGVMGGPHARVKHYPLSLAHEINGQGFEVIHKLYQ